MIINNVVIENFRCYYGRNEISLNNNGKITLIYGDSGYGKSSFLQFFRWMFYGDPDFGSHNDKPLWNISAYNECSSGEEFRMSGQVDFEHLGVNYSLTKAITIKEMIDDRDTKIDTHYELLTLIDDEWVHYKGDISNKINTILPKGLSKYFLLDGEKSRDIVLNSTDLKIAIYSLFGIDAYANASAHIGTKNKKLSVLGNYATAMTSKMSGNINDTPVSQLQEDVQELYETIEEMKLERRNIMGEIDRKNSRREEIFKVLGAATNKDSINQLIKMNQNAIKTNEEEIKKLKTQIGNLFYKCFPYLILSRKASDCSAVLRKKNAALAAGTKDVFENLKKELLKEILEKGTCVCGRTLDEDSNEHINNIIQVMPPDSYSYQFGQFVSKAKKQIQLSQINIIEYDGLIAKITDCEADIFRLEDDTKEKLDELKQLEDAKDLVEELEKIKKDNAELSKKKSGLEGKIAQKKQIYEMSNKMLKHAINNQQVSTEYIEKISFFEDLKKLIDEERKEREKTVKVTLNECVKDIFKKLTTQTELDIDKIQFVNNDFSLRTTYLTGGQLMVDVYSYVIGIVKALQECKMENNENPIIIDAPFAFTGNTQSEHIFKTLPTVSKQTVLLTLDLNKIRNTLSETELYDFYVIKNDSQEKATIERGDINDIKF